MLVFLDAQVHIIVGSNAYQFPTTPRKFDGRPFRSQHMAAFYFSPCQHVPT